VPVWDWGGLRSKVHQSEAKQHQAEVTLTQTQRQVMSNLYSMYNEAMAAKSGVDNLQHVADLAAESVRLTTLRYQAGESTARAHALCTRPCRTRAGLRSGRTALEGAPERGEAATGRGDAHADAASGDEQPVFDVHRGDGRGVGRRPPRAPSIRRPGSAVSSN